MARTKQAALRRDPSSEYTSKPDAKGAKNISARNLDREMNGNEPAQNGEAHVVMNGVVKSNAPLKEKAQEEAGAWQLIFAVGGIYGSL